MKKIYQKLLEGIPDYKEFLTVEEMNSSSKKLAEEHPESVSIFEIGQTRDGIELYCLKIGSGSHTALMFGCPHPNEPIGTMMLEIAGLSFLGLGAEAPSAEWGAMMSNGRSMLQTAPWVILAPGLAIFLTVLVCNLLGEAVRKTVDQG